MNNQNFEYFRGKNKSLFVALIAVLIVFLSVLVISIGVDIPNKIKQGKFIGQGITPINTVVVTGTGEIYTKPDLAITTFSVVNEAKTVGQALSENTKKMNAIIEAMKKQGIEAKDLKTTNFNIYPRYEWRKETDIYIWPEQGKRVLIGYEANQSLEVKIRNMEKIGDIIQSATDAGANQVGELRFTVDNEDNLKSEARKQAIEKAKNKARELSSQLGVKLVRIVSFNEGYDVPYYDYSLKETGIGGAGEPPQVEPGQNKITVTVNITYEIN